jgi:hypothetical protein
MGIDSESPWDNHESSHIKRTRYNPMDHTMDTQYANGSVYRSFGVPPLEYKRFLASPSQGMYHADNIKNNYTVKRIK